jgi:hypothetical protein
VTRLRNGQNRTQLVRSLPQYYQVILTFFAAKAPHFISEIFFLALAVIHVGCLPTIKVLDEIDRRIEDAQRYLEMLQGDGSWMTVSTRPNNIFSILISISLLFERTQKPQ